VNQGSVYARQAGLDGATHSRGRELNGAVGGKNATGRTQVFAAEVPRVFGQRTR